MNEHASRAMPTLRQDERLDTVNEQLLLIQKQNGLTYGTDAFLLAAYCRPSPRARAVDLGSGTGIIPLLLLAKNKVSSVSAAEIQPTFAELIGRNAALNGFEERLTPILCDVRSLSPAMLGGEVDLVVTNPPYMRTDAGKRNESEEKYLARHEVCGTVADFCAAAGRILKHGGKFCCVWRPDRLSELMEALRAAKLEPKRMTFVHADAQSEPCMLLLEAMKGAAPAVRITPPLLLYQEAQEENGTRLLTLKAQRIYDTCLFSKEDFGMI